MPSIKKTTIGQREDVNRIGFGKECKCQLSNVHGLDYNLSSKKISNPLIDITCSAKIVPFAFTYDTLTEVFFKWRNAPNDKT